MVIEEPFTPTAVAIDKLMKIRDIHTFNEIAKSIEVSPKTASNWYYGKCVPNSMNVLKLACYFDTTVDYILGNTDNYTAPLIEPNCQECTTLMSNYWYLHHDIPRVTGLVNLYFPFDSNKQYIILGSLGKVRAKLFLQIKNNSKDISGEISNLNENKNKNIT